ncbi:cold-shock protein [Faecalibacter sp. LW9]|uniref:cold-shock protein n=1 Tax=Faecalibacter sp. LW9 TaxID=3103144 RepID=UPI002B25E216|nr:cold shock domain-containing protein [Faecalibacter sp. LW9]
MQEGRVKFFNKTKRFGFITTGKKDIFVHISELKDHVRPNDKVIFEIENSHNGLNAVNVRLIDTQH